MADPMEVSVKDFPTIYDVSTDSYRPATQEDVDRLVKMVSLLSHSLSAVAKAVDEFRAARKFAEEQLRG
jgi:hypothetical protein